uniref:Membrane-associated transporter protein n=1 Tax=Lygus hesperus TaxID=30085 RepID=A0A146LVX5_LYGHE
MEKLQEYQGFTGRLHGIRDNIKEKYQAWKENRSFQLNLLHKPPQPPTQEGPPSDSKEDYSHVFRSKTRAELVRLSATVMGIEFSYAAETAFVSPALLQIGVKHAQMTMAWALSPIVGFVLTPILGSLSDKCTLPYGRRRPFILLLSFGILLGMLLVPNGKLLGKFFGDQYPPALSDELPGNDTSKSDETSPVPPIEYSHSWGVFFTVLGTVLLDFDADACQSPSRAYLLDIVLPEDQAKGLSTFSLMAGLGGFMGYAMGGYNWDETWIGVMLGGHMKTVFSLITIIFIGCVSYTVTSFSEIPLLRLRETNEFYMPNKTETEATPTHITYGSTSSTSLGDQEQVTSFTADVKAADLNQPNPNGSAERKAADGEQWEALPLETTQTTPEDVPSLRDYLMSIIFMPDSLRILCLTNLFCWMAHVCYSLNFTDYVGESVFGGDPSAPEGSEKYQLYEEGVRFGCWGMSMYSLSCSFYSFIMERLIQRFKAKKVYVGSLVLYGFGMLTMALMNNKFGVIVFSLNAGMMYSTLFTMPYLILANYHSRNMFQVEGEENFRRGLGTDVAVVSSMVFVAQFTLSLCLGSLVSLASTTSIVVYVSSFFGFCASLTATKILYLDL